MRVLLDTHLVVRLLAMDTKQLNDALAGLFIDEGERIVFWHDPEREFIDFMTRLPFLSFGNTPVQIICLDQVSALTVKMRPELSILQKGWQVDERHSVRCG